MRVLMRRSPVSLRERTADRTVTEVEANSRVSALVGRRVARRPRRRKNSPSRRLEARGAVDQNSRHRSMPRGEAPGVAQTEGRGQSHPAARVAQQIRGAPRSGDDRHARAASTFATA